jgi:hypothetical protein
LTVGQSNLRSSKVLDGWLAAAVCRHRRSGVASAFCLMSLLDSHAGRHAGRPADRQASEQVPSRHGWCSDAINRSISSRVVGSRCSSSVRRVYMSRGGHRPPPPTALRREGAGSVDESMAADCSPCRWWNARVDWRAARALARSMGPYKQQVCHCTGTAAGGASAAAAAGITRLDRCHCVVCPT